MEPSAFPEHALEKIEHRIDGRAERGAAFRALHFREGAFILPNPWDVGTARLLAHLGFEALATTSAGFAASVGRRDYAVTRDEMIAHVAVIAAATSLPASADLQNGFGDAPEAAAETIRLAAAAGVVGGRSMTQRARWIVQFVNLNWPSIGFAQQQKRRAHFRFPSR